MFRRYWKSSKNLNKDDEILNETNEDTYKDKYNHKNRIPYENLTFYEKNEIKLFNQDKIYYCGDPKLKTANGKKNNGFDNENDCYILKKNDHIYYRYKIHNKLGNGQYGNVIRATDMKDQSECAIKIIKNTVRHVDMCKREVNILVRLLNNLKINIDEKEKIVLIKKEFYFRNHWCIVTELYYMNLYQYKCNYGSFSEYQIVSICKDLFSGLKYLKSNNIIHADLKPENIFLYDKNANNVVIGDFGLSMYNLSLKYNTNVQTMWYRCPEVIFNITFDFNIDIWSLGAIIYELVTNVELFRAKTQEHLLVKFHQILGIPHIDYIDSSLKIRKYYDINGYPENLYIKGKLIIPGSKKIPDHIFLKDIIDGCLQWDPLNRIDYDVALDRLNQINIKNLDIFNDVPILD